MADRSFLDWPFFEDRHRALADEVDAWSAAHLRGIDHGDTDNACRKLVAALGEAGWLKHTAIDPAVPNSRLDVRSLCLMRETLARHDGLADFAFAMQGLGTGAISLFGSDGTKTALVAANPDGKGDFGIRTERTGIGIGCRQHDHVGAPRRRRFPPGRRKDLDIEWRHRRCLHGVCPHRGRRRAPRGYRHLSCLPTHPDWKLPNASRWWRRIPLRDCLSVKRASRLRR